MRKQPLENTLLVMRRQINETTWQVTQTRHGGHGGQGGQGGQGCHGGGPEADCNMQEQHARAACKRWDKSHLPANIQVVAGYSIKRWNIHVSAERCSVEEKQAEVLEVDAPQLIVA